MGPGQTSEDAKDSVRWVGQGRKVAGSWAGAKVRSKGAAISKVYDKWDGIQRAIAGRTTTNPQRPPNFPRFAFFINRHPLSAICAVSPRFLQIRTKLVRLCRPGLATPKSGRRPTCPCNQPDRSSHRKPQRFVLFPQRSMLKSCHMLPNRMLHFPWFPTVAVSHG